MLSVIVINYNSTKNLNLLLDSLRNLSKISPEIIIIDNNSKDLGELKDIGLNTKLIKNSKNIGFAKAVNIGLKIAKYDIVLLINPDCRLVDNSPLSTFKKILNNKNIGAIGGKIFNRYNIRSNSATSRPSFGIALFEFTNLKKIFPNNYLSRKFWVEDDIKITSPVKVFSLCGAYMFLRKDNRKGLNLFNENYFLYLEDLDYGYKMENNNFEVWFDPDSHIMHEGGASSGSKYKIVLGHWYNSRRLFFHEHLPKYQAYFLDIIFTVEELFLNIYHKITITPNA